MPSLYTYKVTQTREVEVKAIDVIEAAQKATEEFEAYGIADNPKVKVLGLNVEKTI